MLETRFNLNKSLYRNLLTIQGIGHNKAKLICKLMGINPEILLNNISSNKQVEIMEKLFALISVIKKQTTAELTDTKIITSILSPSYISEKQDKNKINTSQIKIRSCIKKNSTLYEDINPYLNTDIIEKSNIFNIKFGNIKNKHSEKISDRFSVFHYELIPVLIEDNLIEHHKKNIQNLIATNSYSGRRIKLGYPARGQRTRSNAKTAKRLNKRRFN